jgi:hypothetical protein
MKKKYMRWDSALSMLFFCSIILPVSGFAQPAVGCSYKDPLVRIDFGSNSAAGDINLSLIKRYNRTESNCPDDGDYSFASYTADCFSGHWHSLSSDHTPGDNDGRMMIVNASERPGIFFMVNIAGLKPGATYEFANWIVNVCRSGFECTTIPPLIKVSILSGGRHVKSFVTGEIYPSADPQWKKYSAEFTLPGDVSTITLQMENENPGGCGNDFALDDITLRECVLPEPVLAKQPPPKLNPATSKTTEATPVQPPAKKPVAPRVEPQQKPEQPALKKTTVTETPISNNRQKNEINKVVTLPRPIATRENPVIKEIKSAASEMLIELYDNGQIDGDTVSIFHNNLLIKSRAALSDKPVSIKIKLDEQHPHHELIMVAENLGSIPPNTSLMIITTRNNRYEVFISSSEQKNAKIVIDLIE